MQPPQARPSSALLSMELAAPCRVHAQGEFAERSLRGSPRERISYGRFRVGDVDVDTPAVSAVRVRRPAHLAHDDGVADFVQPLAERGGVQGREAMVHMTSTPSSSGMGGVDVRILDVIAMQAVEELALEFLAQDSGRRQSRISSIPTPPASTTCRCRAANWPSVLITAARAPLTAAPRVRPRAGRRRRHFAPRQLRGGPGRGSTTKRMVPGTGSLRGGPRPDLGPVKRRGRRGDLSRVCPAKGSEARRETRKKRVPKLPRACSIAPGRAAQHRAHIRRPRNRRAASKSQA